MLSWILAPRGALRARLAVRGATAAVPVAASCVAALFAWGRREDGPAPAPTNFSRQTSFNPTPALPPPSSAGQAPSVGMRYVASIIGLPLRGKTRVALDLSRYLAFFHGARVRVFNIVEYVDCPDKLADDIRGFFEAGDGDGDEHSCGAHGSSGDRDRIAICASSDTDASKSLIWSGHTKWRRRLIEKEVKKRLGAEIFFLEIEVDGSNESLKNYMRRIEISRGLFPGALASVIKNFEQLYVTIQDDGTEDDLSYVKLINYNQKLVTNKMLSTSVGSHMAQLLASVHPYERTIFLTRHGESIYNTEKKLGGDSSLSPLGREYALRLGEFASAVVSRGAERFACVSLSPAQGSRVESLMSRAPVTGETGGIFAKGDWSDWSRGCGSDDLSIIVPGMKLLRLQRGEGLPFEDAPSSVKEVAEVISNGSRSTTLVFAGSASGVSSATSEAPEIHPARLWTSSLRRTRETAAEIKGFTLHLPDGQAWDQLRRRVYRSLDEVYAGEFEGLTYEEIRRRAPDQAELRKQDKLGYRYPRGESYYDIIARLDLLMQHLCTIREQVVIIGHQAVHRLVYAYLKGIDRTQATELQIPLHTVIKIELGSTGEVSETRYFLGPSRRSQDDGQANL